ncbi:DUF4123 domain-containing protein [Vibrio tritonius]|uniref:DUF4123 domain-containing protein n=1 Tax=Vibrio tritonius TaxID=1435069 RepID=UPI00315CBFE7
MHNEVNLLPNLPEVAESEQRWIVVDRALVTDAERYLLQQSNREGFRIEIMNLFFDTQWNEVSEVGPLLVSYHEQTHQWLMEHHPWRFGLIFDSAASLKELTEYWRSRIKCQHVGFEGELFRIYDPIITKHLLTATSEDRVANWMGPITYFCLPDMVEEQYWHIANPVNTTVVDIPEQELSFTFTDEEWQGLTDASEYYICYNLIDHLTQFFPENTKPSTKENFIYIRELLSELKQYGDISEQAGAFYINIVSRLDDDWLTHPEHKPIYELLTDISQPLIERLWTINKLALNYLKNNVSKESY